MAMPRGAASKVEDIGDHRHLGCIGDVKLRSSPEPKAFVKGDCRNLGATRMLLHTLPFMPDRM